MLSDSVVRSSKYVVGVGAFAAPPSICLCFFRGWEYGVSFFALGFVVANAYGCYAAFKARGLVEALTLFLSFALIGSALAAVITAALIASGKWV